MKCYTIGELDITDRAWVSDYVQQVTPLIASHGGRYLTRTAQIEQLEGARKLPQILVIVEWPSREAAQAFYDSDAYRPYRDARHAGAKNEFIVVPAEDMTGAAAIV